VGVILVFAYATAFMETLTISSYPYYSFHNRNRAYSVGSAFYGIYFLVSFPAFYYFDCHIDEYDSDKNKQQRAVSRVTVWDTVVSSCGYGMIILTILDFVRLALKIPFVMDVVGKDDEGSSYSLAQGETAGTCSSSSL
jgi:cycloeucalenol cycloisomerase